MRALWAFIVVCLMAVGGVAPARSLATRAELPGEHARDLHERTPVLPAITAQRAGAAVVAARPRPAIPQLPPAVLATAPALRTTVTVAAVGSARHTHLDPSIAPALRSARGPPR